MKYIHIKSTVWGNTRLEIDLKEKYTCGMNEGVLYVYSQKYGGDEKTNNKIPQPNFGKTHELPVKQDYRAQNFQKSYQ